MGDLGRLGGLPLLPLALLFGLNAVDELDRVAFGVLTPRIRDHFDLSLGGVSALVAITGVAVTLGSVLIGYYADRASRVRLALGAAAIWCLFSLGTGLALTLLIVAITRSGSGIAKAVNDPVHRSLLADYYPTSVRGFVYYAHAGANALGTAAGPLLAGGIAHLLGWRAPFVLFAIPTAVLVLIGIARLREPVRGRFERAEAGGDTAVVDAEEEPPSFGEAWRSIHNIPSLKRTLISLPFLAVSFVGLAALVSLLLDERYGVDELQLGLIFSIGAVFQLVAFTVFGAWTSDAVVNDPTRIYRIVLAAAPVTAAAFVAISVAPNLTLAAVALTVLQVAVTPLIAGPATVLSLVIPPRVRTVGFAAGGLYVLPGFFLYLLIGGLADSRGFTFAFVAMAPILLVGTAVLVSASRYIASDVERVRSATLARAEAAEARRRGQAKLLIARGVDVRYGSTQVLFGVDIEVDDGEIVALLGTNGAGKSTFLNAVTGLVAPTAGAIVFDGRDITHLPANEAAALGIVMVPGGKGVFPTMTVAENFRLAGWLYEKDTAHVEAATEEVLEYFPILRERWNEKAGNMSGGEQQMLTLGQAFIAKPKLLLIDELSLGLAPVIVEQLLGIVRAIHASGTTVVLVEQSVNVAITLADRAIFMEKGQVRFDGPTAELLDRPDVLRAVFLHGASERTADARPRAGLVDRDERRDALERTSSVLEVSELSVSFGGIHAVRNVDLDVRAGEILGLIGPNGAGKTTILDLVSGYLVPSHGTILLHGEDVTSLSPHRRAARGLGRSFQDARLWPSLTVVEALAIALERKLETRDPIAAALLSPATVASEDAAREEVERLLELLHLEAFANKFVGELSTGSRRVVDLACCVAHEPSVLLLDEPSSGIAQRETEALGPVLLDIRDVTGAAILVIEHDMPLIQGISDRLVALEAGAVVAVGEPAEVISHPRVVEAYLGGTDEVINRSGAR